MILAGYPDDMDRPLNMNPGLRSRIGLTVDFQDYTDEELVDILVGMFTRNYYVASPAGLDRIHERLPVTRRTRTFGNARIMRNVFEAAIRVRGGRLAATVHPATDKQLRTVFADDVTTALDQVLPAAAVPAPSAGHKRRVRLTGVPNAREKGWVTCTQNEVPEGIRPITAPTTHKQPRPAADAAQAAVITKTVADIRRPRSR